MTPTNTGMLNLKSLGATEFQQKHHFIGFEVCFYLMYQSGFVYICIQILYSDLNLILFIYFQIIIIIKTI